MTFWSTCCGSSGRSRELYPDTCRFSPSGAVFEGVPAGGTWDLYGYTLSGRKGGPRRLRALHRGVAAPCGAARLQGKPAQLGIYGAQVLGVDEMRYST